MKIRSSSLYLSAAILSAHSSLANSTLEADSISVDDASGLVEAIGNVRVQADGNTLATDKLLVARDPSADGSTLEVPTSLSLTQADGTKITADAANLNSQLNSGSFSNLSLIPTQGGRFAAARAEKSGTDLTLKGAVFTACPACKENTKAAPLWQIRAARINYDRAAQDVSYRHSRLEVFGMPLFYLPYMAHAGPEVEKRSGFLAPSFGSSGDFGTAIETPYLVDLAPNYDLNLTPRISEKQEPFLTAEWRHLTQNGQYELTAYGHSPKDDLLHDPSKDQRSGLIGSGRFNLAGWDVDFAVQQASDDLFFRSYRLNSLSRLENRLRATRQFANQRLSLSTHNYRNTTQSETESTVDLIAPSLTHNIYIADAPFGGTLNITNRLTHMVRDLGIDTTHAQSNIDWAARHITQGGFVLSARNRLAIDAYDYKAETETLQEKADAANETLSANALALGIAYPLQRITANDRQTLSPSLQIVGATNNEKYENVPYIASTGLDLTRAQLFQPLATQNEASRVNYGLAHTLSLGARLQTAFFIGQSYNLSDRQFDDVKSGYGSGRSALLADWSLAAGPLKLAQQARFSKTGDSLLRSESTAALGFANLAISAGHSFYEAGQSGTSVMEEAFGQLDWQMSGRWRVESSLRENLETGNRVRADAILSYEDDCTLLGLSLTRDYSRIDASNIEPETSINLTFTLKTIGG